MAFEPKNITKENVLNAVQKIMDDDIKLNTSRKYNVLIDDIEYPPKEIMRYAHQDMNGEFVWELGGGDPTNNLLENLGFTITEKGSNSDTLNNFFVIINKVKTIIPESEFKFKSIRENSRYVWVEDPNNIIGKKDAHYEFVIRKDSIYLELHFEKASNRNDFKESLQFDNPKVEWIKWAKAQSLQFKAVYSLTEEDVPNRMAEDLREFDAIVGDDVRAIIERLPDLKMDNKEAFKEYLKNEYKKNSGAPSSYIKALEYLSNSSDVNRNIFEIEDHYFLKKLYKETLLNQKKNEGKYYNDAHSYGSGGHYSAALFVYMDFLKTKENNKIPKKMSSIPLNQILYGPPGTGKTYNTINKAIEIVNPDFDLTQDRNIVKLEFDRLCKEKKIHFTTFHQSLSYEDFIEGIKPCIEEEDDNTELKYEIQNGIFKRISDEASFELLSNSESVSNPLLNFSAKFDAFLTEVARKLEENEEVGISTKTGNKLVILSISDRGNFNIKHVDGERIYTVSKQRLMRLKEGINDLYSVENMNRDFRAVIGGSNSSVYWSIWNAVENTILDEEEVVSERKWSESDKSDFVESSKPEDYKDKNGSPYVIIIDEINRGNVSQIFGELITLIEDEKRLGNDEGLKIQLPYSKKNYGVPNNLFILGTMNTADRSVEALDTALRRRFSFVEMLPKPEIIEKGKSNGKVGDVDLVQLLKTINERIEVLVDRDHTIGHAFFMGVDSLKSLQAVIADKIIPLLQEYFYGDYHKMEMVIGDLFFNKAKVNKIKFAVKSELHFEGEVYTIKDVKGMEEADFMKALKGVESVEN